jgi:hypothetical protein
VEHVVGERNFVKVPPIIALESIPNNARRFHDSSDREKNPTKLRLSNLAAVSTLYSIST